MTVPLRLVVPGYGKGQEASDVGMLTNVFAYLKGLVEEKPAEGAGAKVPDASGDGAPKAKQEASGQSAAPRRSSRRSAKGEAAKERLAQKRAARKQAKQQ